jgi:hypothetical protein
MLVRVVGGNLIDVRGRRAASSDKLCSPPRPASSRYRDPVRAGTPAASAPFLFLAGFLAAPRTASSPGVSALLMDVTLSAAAGRGGHFQLGDPRRELVRGDRLRLRGARAGYAVMWSAHVL